MIQFQLANRVGVNEGQDHRINHVGSVVQLAVYSVGTYCVFGIVLRTIAVTVVLLLLQNVTNNTNDHRIVVAATLHAAQDVGVDGVDDVQLLSEFVNLTLVNEFPSFSHQVFTLTC